jgi:hypothetical protein
MKSLALALATAWLGAATAAHAATPVTLTTGALTLARTANVHVVVTAQDGATEEVYFAADEIAAGTITKDVSLDVATLTDCMVDWRFAPQAGDVLPELAGAPADVDDLALPCSINTSLGTVDVAPLTTVQPLAIIVPASVWSARGAELSYRLVIHQAHGRPWTYADHARTVVQSAQDDRLDLAIFTSGCLDYRFGYSWIDGASATAWAETSFIGTEFVFN